MTENTTAPQTVSLSPDDASQFLDDVDVTIERARFELFNYNNTTKDVVSLVVTMRADGAEKPRVEHMFLGSTNSFNIGPEGRSLAPKGNVERLMGGSEAMRFLASVRDAEGGADVNKRLKTGDPAVLDGLRIHVVQVNTGRKTKKGKDITNFKCTKVLGYTSGQTATAGNGKASTDEVIPILAAALTANGGKLARASLFTAISKVAPGNPDYIRIAYDADFLKTGGNGKWAYDPTSDLIVALTS